MGTICAGFGAYGNGLVDRSIEVEPGRFGLYGSNAKRLGHGKRAIFRGWVRCSEQCHLDFQSESKGQLLRSVLVGAGGGIVPI